MRKGSTTSAILLVALVISIAGVLGEPSPSIRDQDNLSANRGLGVGIIVGAPSELFLSYSLLNRLDLEGWLGYLAGDIYFGGALRFRLLDLRTFDLFLYTATGNSYKEAALLGWGGTILTAGVDVEYSITKHLALDLLVASGIHLSSAGGLSLLLSYGFGAAYYF